MIDNPDVYKSSDFISDRTLSYGDLDRIYVQRIVLKGEPPMGELRSSPAFDVTE